MGVDYDICDVCGDTYPDCGRYGSCEGCGKTWCGVCDRKIETFWYGDDGYCDLCLNTKVPEPTRDEVYDYALELLGKTHAELARELQQTDEFRGRVTEFTCTGDHADCNPECEKLEELFEDPELKNYMATKRKGLCCVAAKREQPCGKCARKRIKVVEWHEE